VSPTDDLPAIDVSALADLGPGSVPLFDVRQPDEYAEGHVPGAVLVPLGEVPDHLADFPTDRPVYVVCRSGARSANACGFLRASGVDAINVTGGTLAWIEAGFDVVAGGEPG
jgi:rhodanese-related sulfurtransferase